MLLRRAPFVQIARSVCERRTFHSVHVKIRKSHPPNLTLFPTHRFAHNAVKCWQCGIQRKHLGDLFCEQCKHIQKPSDNSNYFKIFGLTEQFDIDQKQLTDKFRQMQSQLHPDKFTTKSEREKDISGEFSALVNKAYKTLQQPLNRALHLLHLRGGVLEEGQKIDNPAFLMEIMELNEEVEAAASEAALSELKQKNDARLVEISSEVKSCFQSNQIDKAKEAIIKMKYYNSVGVYVNKLIRDG